VLLGIFTGQPNLEAVAAQFGLRLIANPRPGIAVFQRKA
jgi:hypothetical protein